MQDFFTLILVQQKSVSVLHSMRFRSEFQGEAPTGRDPLYRYSRGASERPKNRGKIERQKTLRTGFSSCFKRLFMALRTHLLD